MVIVSKRRSILRDKVMVALWMAYTMLNIFTHFIVTWVGGAGTIIIVYLFFLYFVFFYGENTHRGVIPKIPLLCFLALYCLIMLFLNANAPTYTVFGLELNYSVWNMLTFIPKVLSAAAIIEKSSEEMLDWTRVWFVVTSSVTLFFSITLLIIDSTVLKLSATGHGEYYPLVFDFQTIAGFAVIIPAFLCYFGNARHRILFAIFIAAVVVGVSMASFFISILSMLVGAIAFFVLKIKRRWLRILITTLTTAGLLVQAWNSNSLTAVKAFSGIIPFPEISKRVSQLVLFYEKGVMADTTSRIRMYMESLERIFQHPFMGSLFWDNTVKISGHSTIMDIWIGCGLITLLLFVLFLISVYRYQLDAFCETRSQSSAVLATFVSFLFFIIFNPLFASPNIMVFWLMIPVFLVEPKRTGVVLSVLQ